MKLYHATRRDNLPSIMSEGLKTAHYGDVHGRMEYALSEPCVYLSSRPESGNLNGNLFEEDGERYEVVVIEIDATGLDPDKFYPDDALYYVIDEDYTEFWENEPERPHLIADFSARFSMDEHKAERLLSSCYERGEEHYQHILKEMWKEYMAAEGEVAYASDVPISAILSVRPYPHYADVEPGV